MSGVVSDRSPAAVFARRPLLTGAAVGVASLLPHFFLAPPASLALASTLISLIAGVYFGFAEMNGSGRDQIVEFAVASLFLVAGLLGLLGWPLLVPIAYLAHGAWDAAHHHRCRLPLVSIPRWYVPWCAIIDLIVGAGLLILWRRAGIV